MLELMRIPYTGSGVLASALALHKIMAKKIFLCEEIPTPAFEVFQRQEIEKDPMKKISLPYHSSSNQRERVPRLESRLPGQKKNLSLPSKRQPSTTTRYWQRRL